MPLPKPEYFSSKTIEFGETLKLHELKEMLYQWGYHFTDIAAQRGEVSFRGDIIDIYPIDADKPYRISLFDEEVETIQHYDESTQKRLNEELESLTFTPAFLALKKEEHEALKKRCEHSRYDTFVKDIDSLGLWHLEELAESALEQFSGVLASNLDDELKRGRACALALGLRHFVTWETEQVRIWQVEKDDVTEHQVFPLGDPENLESFRYLLADLLNALKLLAVLGAIPATELSHWYLCNLFQITLQQALPPLVEAYRSQRSEIDEHSPEDADICAHEAGRMLLLQVLALLWYDKFPEAILPEKMERAIELSLPELPDFPRETLALKTTIKPPALPLETAVSFHHLLK